MMNDTFMKEKPVLPLILLYNKPLEYAQLVLGGEVEHYLSLGCDHGRLED